MIAAYKCVVVANGLFPTGKLAGKALREAEFIIACDGATESLVEHGVEPDVVVGDLDSLSDDLRRVYAGKLYEVRDQEINDLTKAVRYARDRGYREVLILGATGLREDHTLGNISLLADYMVDFERVEMLSDYGLFTPICRTTDLPSYLGQQVSLFSLYPCGPISVEGLRYPICHRSLFQWWEGTLNEALGDSFRVVLHEAFSRLIVYRTMG